jgi:hypothetical protein
MTAAYGLRPPDDGVVLGYSGMKPVNQKKLRKAQ